MSSTCRSPCWLKATSSFGFDERPSYRYPPGVTLRRVRNGPTPLAAHSEIATLRSGTTHPSWSGGSEKGLLTCGASHALSSHAREVSRRSREEAGVHRGAPPRAHSERKTSAN